MDIEVIGQGDGGVETAVFDSTQGLLQILYLEIVP